MAVRSGSGLAHSERSGLYNEPAQNSRALFARSGTQCRLRNPPSVRSESRWYPPKRDLGSQMTVDGKYLAWCLTAFTRYNRNARVPSGCKISYIM